MFCPGLNDNIRAAPGNDIARALPVAGGKSIDVILVSMSRDDCMQLAVALVANVLCHSDQQSVGCTSRCTGTTEIDEDMTVFGFIVKCEQKAITESYLVGA